MASTHIDFDLKGVAKELKERRIAVPVYQRSYSWEQDEVEEFWNDLDIAFKDTTAEYFLGTIVLTNEADPGKVTVIDGQQRLATTAILLAAIRDEYATRGDAERSRAVRAYLSSTDLATATEEAHLILNSDDAHFFEETVINGDALAPTKASHKLIAGALAFLKTKVAEVAKSGGKDWAKRLYERVQFLADRVRAIVLTVPTDADAFLIFETLNDRGADLTIADLLKNYLFGHAGSAKLDAVRDGWMQALATLDITAENALFTTFLRQYWSSIHGAVRERDLYKSIKERVSSSPHVVTFVSQLQEAAIHYAALLNSDAEMWDELGGSSRENIQTLNRLELEQNRPLLLAALQHFLPAEKKKLLRAMVSWSVRGLIVGGIGGGTAERVYCTAASKIRQGFIKTAAEVLKEVSPIVPSDSDFATAFGIVRVPRAQLARYYLYALENAKNGYKEPELVPNANEEQVNLEHVLPKRASDKDWGSAFNAEERKEYLHRLGNLALLAKGPNGQIGSKPFAKKKPILAASLLLLTNEVGAEAHWTKSTIRARQERMAKLAVKAWPRNV